MAYHYLGNEFALQLVYVALWSVEPSCQLRSSRDQVIGRVAKHLLGRELRNVIDADSSYRLQYLCASIAYGNERFNSLI